MELRQNRGLLRLTRELLTTVGVAFETETFAASSLSRRGIDATACGKTNQSSSCGRIEVDRDYQSGESLIGLAVAPAVAQL